MRTDSRSRDLGCILVIMLSFTMSGCANYLAFGTATKVGLDISQRADQMVDVTLGYQRVEVVSIPAGNADQQDATDNQDTYSVLGRFHFEYGNPWKDEPVRLNQLFATGMAARQAAENPQMQEVFGQAAGIIAKKSEKGQQP